MKKIRKSFFARKPMKVPEKITFVGKDGKLISFKAKRIKTKPSKIKFKFIRKSYKKTK